VDIDPVLSDRLGVRLVFVVDMQF